MRAAIELALAPAAAAGRLALRAVGRSRPLDPSEIRRIAFIKLDHLGDVIMAEPCLRALKAWAPRASLTVVARRASTVVLERLPAVDHVVMQDVPWILPHTTTRESFTACLALGRQLRAGRFDLAVDLRYHNRWDSLLLSLSGARARLGFDAGGFGFGLTHRAPWPRRGHEIDRGADALEAFGIPVPDRVPRFPLRSAERAAAAARLKGRGPVVAIHVGAGNAVKRWMPDRFAALAGLLSRRARVAVLAGPDEVITGAQVARAVPPAKLIDLRGRLTLGQMAAVIARADAFVGNDGGAGHVAAAVGAPTVIVFSGTAIAADWAPRGPKVRVLERWVPCKPCHSTWCPYGQECLRRVSVADTFAATIALLRQA